jgi:hypothetical protein
MYASYYDRVNIKITKPFRTKNEEQEASEQRRATDQRRMTYKRRAKEQSDEREASCLSVTHQLGSRMVYKIAARSEGCANKQNEKERPKREEEARARQA